MEGIMSNRDSNGVYKVIGNCKIFKDRVNIYDYNPKTKSVLIKVYPNIANDYKEYNWQIYGVKNINLY
jgi:hypothetical protein